MSFSSCEQPDPSWVTEGLGFSHWENGGSEEEISQHPATASPGPVPAPAYSPPSQGQPPVPGHFQRRRGLLHQLSCAKKEGYPTVPGLHGQVHFPWRSCALALLRGETPEGCGSTHTRCFLTSLNPTPRLGRVTWCQCAQPPQMSPGLEEQDMSGLGLQGGTPTVTSCLSGFCLLSGSSPKEHTQRTLAIVRNWGVPVVAQCKQI